MAGALVNQLVQGVLLGGLYTLFATGLSLSAGVMRFVNIAHGDFIVLACFALLTLTTTLGLDPVVGTIVVLPIAFATGFVLQRYLLQRVVGENVLLVILVTFGLSIIIQNGLLETYGADPQKVAGGWVETASFALAPGVNVGVFSVITFAAAVLVCGGLDLFLYRSGIGAKIRAVSDDVAAADLIGLSSARIYAVAMGICFVTIGIAAGFMSVWSNFDPVLRPDPAADRLRGHRAWRAGQHVGLARRRNRARGRPDHRRAVRHRLADAGRPYRLPGGPGGAPARPVPEILRWPCGQPRSTPRGSSWPPPCLCSARRPCCSPIPNWYC